MQSSVASIELNKNISNTRPIEKTQSINTNPFFQYLTNSKLNTNTPNQKAAGEGILGNSQTRQSFNQQATVDNSNDPRRALRGNLRNQKPQQSYQQVNSKKTQIQRSYPNELREKRSRSRDKNKSHYYRQNSEDNQKKQKKDQHYRKTKICPLFQKGQCKKGPDCHFAHGYKQLRNLPNFTKTRLCIAFQKGQCKYPTSQCKYAHGQSELRTINQDGTYSIGPGRKQPGNKNRNNQYRPQRDSQSAQRRDKKYNKSESRQNSNERRKKDIEKQTFYKKALPLTNDYQKFLYGDTGLNLPQFKIQDQSYMLPSEKAENSNKVDPYSIDPYALPFNKTLQQPYNLPTLSSSYINEKQSYYRGHSKEFSKQPESKRHNFSQKNREAMRNDNTIYTNHKDVYRNTSNFNFNPPQSNQRYRDQPNGSFYQDKIDSSSDFSKNSNKAFFRPNYQGSTYAPQSNHKVFQKYSNFPEPLVVSSQKGFLPNNASNYGEKQPVYYQNQPFYNPAMKKNFDDSYNGYQGLNTQATYPINSSFVQGNLYPPINSYPPSVHSYPQGSTYPNSGSLEVYPALENPSSGNQISSRYTNNFQKNKYSNYSNNPSNR